MSEWRQQSSFNAGGAAAERSPEVRQIIAELEDIARNTSKCGLQLGQLNCSPLQASSWTAIGWNNPPVTQGQNVIPSTYQHAFNGGGSGIHCTQVGQHQSGLHTQPAAQCIGNVKKGTHWNHQLSQGPTAPSTVTQANFRGTACNQFMSDRSCLLTILSNNPSSNWNYSQNQLRNTVYPYPMKQAGGNTYTTRTASMTHYSANGGNKEVSNGQMNGSISTNVGSAMTASTNLIYPLAGMNNRLKGPQEVISAQRLPNCAQEASPVHGAGTWGHGQGTSAVGSSVVQNANSHPSRLEGLCVTSRMQAQEAHSNGSTKAADLASALQSRDDTLLRKIHWQDGIWSRKSSTETNQTMYTTPRLPPLTLIRNSSFTNGNRDSNTICYSSSPHVQPSSGPYDARQPQQNLSSNSKGGIISHSSTFVHQQSNSYPAVCLPPPFAPQQQKSISNNSQGSEVLCENLPHVHQSRESSHQRLCQNRAAESSALGQDSGQASHGISVEPIQSFCTTTNTSSTFSADPHTLKCSYSSPSNHVVKSCGQQQSGMNADALANQHMKENCLSVEKVRQRNPKNIPFPSYILTKERNQMPEGKTSEVDSGKPSGRCNYQNDSEEGAKCLDTDTSSPACVQQLQNTQKHKNTSTASGGMRAIAVVPPIAQQSSTGQASGITNKDKKSKIQHSFPDKSVEGNPESEPSNSRLSHNVEESTPSISSSLCDMTPEISTTVGVVEAEPSIQQSAVSAETPTVSVGSSQPQPSANKDQELLSKEDAFDLTTVPVIVWTADKLRELIATLENDSTSPEPKVEESSTPHVVRIFWGDCEQNLYDALNSNMEKSICDTWKTCTKDENPVIFSEINSPCKVKLAEKCLILGPDDYISNDLVCQPLLLDLCEQSDNMDKHNVNSLELGIHITERENQKMKADETEKCNVEEPVTDTVDSVELLQKQPQTEKLGPLVDVSDPLSLLEIKILTPTEARKFHLFDSQPSENDTVEDPQTKHGVEENILELQTKMSATADNDLNIEHMYSNLEILIVAAEQLWSKPLSAQELCRSDSSNTDTDNAAFGKAETTLTESTVKAMQSAGLQENPRGTVSCSLRQSFHSRKKRKLMRRKKIQKSKSKLQFQKRLLPNDKTVEKESPYSPPSSAIKQNVDRSHDYRQKTLNDTNTHNDDTLNVPKLPFSICCKNQQLRGSKANTLLSERSQIISVVSEGSIARLALYGSSPQRRKYKPCPSTTVTEPPRKMTLKLHSQKRNLSDEGYFAKRSTARQKVYSSWESSLFHVSKKPCESVSSDFVGNSKNELRNPALMPVKEKVLHSKQFNFKEP